MSRRLAYPRNLGQGDERICASYFSVKELAATGIEPV